MKDFIYTFGVFLEREINFLFLPFFFHLENIYFYVKGILNNQLTSVIMIMIMKKSVRDISYCFDIHINVNY